MNSLRHLRYDSDIFVVTMVIWNKSIISENKESSSMLKRCYSRKKYLSKLKEHRFPAALSKELSFKCFSVMIYDHDHCFYCRTNYVVLATDINI